MIIPMCRLSIFGDFHMLEPTSANVVTWTQALQEDGYEMLPSVIQPTAPVPLPVALSSPPQFIQFSESNRKGTGQFLRLTNQRIDAEFTMLDSESWLESLKSVFSSLSKLLHTGIKFVEGTKGTRLAYYVDALIKEPSSHAFKAFYCENNFGLHFGDSGMANCTEWAHRFNQKMSLPTVSGEEPCNLILLMESSVFQKISPDMPKAESYPGLHVAADLNTLGENDTPRFSIDDIEAFYPEAMNSHINVLQNIMEMLEQ